MVLTLKEQSSGKARDQKSLGPSFMLNYFSGTGNI